MILASSMPPTDELLERYSYDISLGVLYHLKRGCGVTVGKQAGSLDEKSGYVRLKIRGKLYLAHRIILKMITGFDSSSVQVDHIDGNRSNNRIENLRAASHGENQANGEVYKNNKTGLRGVYWNKQHKKYAASIQHKLKRKHIGLFPDPISAAVAYNAKALELFGEFAKLNDINGGLR